MPDADYVRLSRGEPVAGSGCEGECADVCAELAG